MRLNKARAVLREIITSANDDPEYLEKLRNNPLDALVEEGLPYDVIEDYIREAGWEAEVSGYMLPECANTCALTKQQ